MNYSKSGHVILKRHWVVLGFLLLISTGYEKTLYSYYPFINLAVLAIFMSIITFFWGSLFKVDLKQTLVAFVFSIAVIASLLRGDVGDFLKYSLLVFIIIFLMKYLNDLDFDLILKISALIALFVSISGMGMYLLNIGYGIHNGRMSGLVFDPNYTAVLSGYGFLYFFMNSFCGQARNRLGLIYASICFFAVLLTFSKGAIVAIIISLYLYLLIKKSVLRLVVSSLFFTLFIFAIKDLLFDLLSHYEMFRVDMGVNKRDIYALLALEGMARAPFIGNGVSSIESVISYYGYGNSSFHNYYLEAGFINGLPFLVSLILLVLFSFYRVFLFDTKTAALLLFFIVLANNFSFSLGGVGMISIIFTVLTLKSLRLNE